MESEFACEIVWSDPDLLELRAQVSFQGWAGRERAYVTRGDLTAFAAALERVANGGSEAALRGGQRDLKFVELRVFEYGLARRLGLEVVMGEAAGREIGRPSYERELRISVPFERGMLSRFAADLRTMVAAESGQAVLPLLQDWPF